MPETHPFSDAQVLTYVEQLHAIVDQLASQVAARHGPRIKCKIGCADCCQDDLTVSAPEALRIRSAHADLLSHGTPAPPGACAFLDEDRSCRIYAERPYVCRTQGLPLRWIEALSSEGELVERRDICPLNLPEGPPLETLSPDDCWTIGPIEQRLAAVSATPERIALRTLFRALHSTSD